MPEVLFYEGNLIQFAKKVLLEGVSLMYSIPWQFYILSYLLKIPMSRSYNCGKFSTVSEPKRSFSMTNPLPILIPHQFREAVEEKLKYMVENDLIEGPLPPSECKGWIHNIVVTKKS